MAKKAQLLLLLFKNNKFKTILLEEFFGKQTFTFGISLQVCT